MYKNPKYIIMSSSYQPVYNFISYKNDIYFIFN